MTRSIIQTTLGTPPHPNMKRHFIVCITIALCLCAGAQAQGIFTVLTYNIENAFDTIHDEGKNDYEYSPDNKRNWKHQRLMKKLRDVGKVIVAADEDRPIDLVALCEVENGNVLHLLTRQTHLASLGYRYIVTESADPRGIDVALLYSPATFHPVDTQMIRPVLSTHPTRDILHVAGTIATHDTLDVFVVHLPSKRGGNAAQHRSEQVTDLLVSHIDSVRSTRQHPNILVMGDFNAEPHSPQLKTLTRQLPLTDPVEKLRPGTYKYQGEWSSIDHILPYTTTLSLQQTNIVALPFLLEPDQTNGGTKPSRTYLGTVYKGGVSDHLPVICIFQMKQGLM